MIWQPSKNTHSFFQVIPALLSVSIILLPAVVFAQEKNKDPFKTAKNEKKPVIVDADVVEYFGDGRRITGKGNIKVNHGDIRLTADFADVDMDKNEAVATGNVVVYRGNMIIKGEKLFYKMDTKKGYMEYKSQELKTGKEYVEIISDDVRLLAKRIDFDLEVNSAMVYEDAELYKGQAKLTGKCLAYDFNKKTGAFRSLEVACEPWYLKAGESQHLNEKVIKAKRAYATTCEEENPHYRIKGKPVYYYVNEKIVVKNAVFFVGHIPLFYFPSWQQSLKDKRATVTVGAGRTKNWGWYILTSWKYYINENLEGRIHLDERELKGFASGIDADYKIPGCGGGKIKTYYMDERDISKNKNGQRMVHEEERYRGQVKYRYQADRSTLAMFEYNKLSDKTFIRDYLYKEYSEDIQPISEGSVSRSFENYNYSVYARKRTNRFYSETEKLPEIKYYLGGYELGDSNLYYHCEAGLANLNQKAANSALDTDANRLDIYNELKYPTKLPGALSWINFIPYAGTRQTYYSKDSMGEEEDLVKGMMCYGFETNTKFYRYLDCRGDFFGIEINKLRHIVTPSVKYNFIHRPTIPISKFGAFDEIDAIDKTNTFTFGLENNLQTKWKRDNGTDFETVDLIYFYPHVDYYPKIPWGQRSFSLVTSELNFRPKRWLSVDTDTVYNQYQQRFQTANIDFSANWCEKWKLGLGKRYERDISEQTTADLYYKINRFWQTRIYGRYESYAERLNGFEYTIYRDLHCWLMEVTYHLERNLNGSVADRAIWLVFKLKAFPETPVQFGSSYETVKRWY